MLWEACGVRAARGPSLMDHVRSMSFDDDGGWSECGTKQIHDDGSTGAA